MTKLISEITMIPSGVLTHEVDPRACSVAARMSWASERETTCLEDMAYRMVGFFDIIMEPKHVECDKAFLHLQEEIMKRPADQSLFAWRKEQAQQSEVPISP